MKYFKPDKKIIRKYGINGKKYIVVRLINWDATHDIAKRGISDINKFLNILSEKYEMLITSEFPILNKWEKKH